MKLCECGCGNSAPISDYTNINRGVRKGYPSRFIKGHNRKHRLPFPEIFWSRVNKEGPIHRTLGTCWMWTHAACSQGHYGCMGVEGKIKGAHVIAWYLAMGTWPEKLVLHKCDNGLCVRFSHLFEGTHSDNTRDMDKKGRRGKKP